MTFLILWKHAQLYRFTEALLIYLLDSLYDLEESGSAGDTVFFQGGGNGKAYRFFGTGKIGNNEVGAQGIVFAVRALNAGVEAL